MGFRIIVFCVLTLPLMTKNISTLEKNLFFVSSNRIEVHFNEVLSVDAFKWGDRANVNG